MGVWLCERGGRCVDGGQSIPNKKNRPSDAGVMLQLSICDILVLITAVGLDNLGRGFLSPPSRLIWRTPAAAALFFAKMRCCQSLRRSGTETRLLTLMRIMRMLDGVEPGRCC